jgi:hypothetical protein
VNLEATVIREGIAYPLSLRTILYDDHDATAIVHISYGDATMLARPAAGGFCLLVVFSEPRARRRRPTGV